jgi:hypothetical protein
MDTFFKDLGDAVLQQWKRENFSLETFPKIAGKALEKHPPAKRVDLSKLMRDFLLTEDHPAQTDSPFGEPELIVYNHSRFYIQLLFWMDGTTAIHQHAFSGAFHVMHGSSIHAHYAFDNARPITPFMSVGDVRMTVIEILETGRTVPIASGHRTIHSLFHLDSPSVTVVVRTQHDPGTGPQFNYHPPHMAIDPMHSDLLTLRRTQLLDVLEQTEDPGYAGLVLEMLTDLDFERGFHILQHAMGHLQQLEEWEAALKLFQKKHGALATGVAATLREEVRRNVIKSLRGSILEPEHRFFLALLMNAPTRADLLSLVKQRFKKQPPVEIVMRWMQELMETTDGGVTILDASFPESLAIDRDSQPELFLSAFRHFLKPEQKLPPNLRDLTAAVIKQLRTAFSESTLSLLTAVLPP